MHVVNNGAAALALVTCALAMGRTVVVARGELVEIGDGFRIPELLESVGARLREVGTTNRVRLADYAAAIDDDTAFVLKVHPSNFLVSGFTSAVPVAELAPLPAPGRRRHRLRAARAASRGCPTSRAPPPRLRAGADLVTASGDKLLGGPQCGLLLGRADLVERLRRHPFARALRVDKLTLAALEATLTGPPPPVRAPWPRRRQALRARAERIAARAGRLRRRRRVASEAAVGGGGAPGVDLDSAAVALPSTWPSRCGPGEPPVVGRVERGRLLLDLIAVAPAEDDAAVSTPYARPPRARGADRCTSSRPPVTSTTASPRWSRRSPAATPTGWRRSAGAGCRSSSATAGRRCPASGEVAFVDVPGHERFVSTMLAGIGPVPGVLLRGRRRRPVDAAGRRAPRRARCPRRPARRRRRHPLGPRRPGRRAAKRAAYEVGRTSLRGRPGRRGERPDRRGARRAARSQLVAMVGRLPAPDPAADVRLWVDRRFTVQGAGTVVTGTLPAGTIARGDSLELRRGRPAVRVRGVQSLGEPVETACGVARVALNVTGDDLDRAGPRRRAGDPGRLHFAGRRSSTSRTRDRSGTDSFLVAPQRPLLHVGATAVGPLSVRWAGSRPPGARTPAAAAGRRPGAAARPRAAADVGGRRARPAPPAACGAGAPAARRAKELRSSRRVSRPCLRGRARRGSCPSRCSRASVSGLDPRRPPRSSLLTAG